MPLFIYFFGILCIYFGAFFPDIKYYLSAKKSRGKNAGIKMRKSAHFFSPLDDWAHVIGALDFVVSFHFLLRRHQY